MNKRYWLRGALLFVVLHAIVFLFLVGSNYLRNKNIVQYEPWPATMAMLIPDFPVFVILDNPIFSILRGINSSFLVFVFGTLQWFMIGGILGWLYGKIKNKNKVI